MKSKEYPNFASNNEDGMVPEIPLDDLVLVTEEGTELQHWHRPFSQNTLTLLRWVTQQYPFINMTGSLVESGSCRYPITDEDRETAYITGNLYVDLGRELLLFNDEIATHSLMVAASLTLCAGEMTDEQFATAFCLCDFDNQPDLSLWSNFVEEIEEQPKVKEYELKAQEEIAFLCRIYHLEPSTTHPIIDSQQQIELSSRLKELYSDLLNYTFSSNVRNFLILNASRLLQIGNITDTDFVEICTAYDDSINQARSGRIYEEEALGEEVDDDDYDEGEDDNDALYGDILWNKS